MVSTECGHSGLKYTRRRAPASRYIPGSGIPIKPINGSKYYTFSQAVPASSFWSLSNSMQKRRGKAWEKESRAWRQVNVSRREGGGASLVPSPPPQLSSLAVRIGLVKIITWCMLLSTSHTLLLKFFSPVPRRTVSWERDWNYNAAVATISIDCVQIEAIYVKRDVPRAS